MLNDNSVMRYRPLRFITSWCAQFLVAGACVAAAGPSAAQEDTAMLSPTNEAVPFCYLSGTSRSWPLSQTSLPQDVEVTLSARQGERGLAQGRQLAWPGFTVSLDRNGHLTVTSGDADERRVFELDIAVDGPGIQEHQTIVLQPAPPSRPLSYYADFGDDIIRMFWNSKTGLFAPIVKCGFDQYFRRLQVHGVSRLVVWLGPFPYIVPEASRSGRAWELYEAQARAILDSDALLQVLKQRSGFKAWGWIRELMHLRLMDDFGTMLTRSAEQHGIALSISFRPFEPALMKYYQVPAFDEDGTFLWTFLPMALPDVGLNPQTTCFAHYREILREMGHDEHARVGAIVLNVRDGADILLDAQRRGDMPLRIVASAFPPLQDDSFVLQRDALGGFSLRPYREIRDQARVRRTVLTDYSLSLSEDGSVLVQDLQIPPDCRYLIIRAAVETAAALQVDSHEPVALLASSGIQLGRNNVYWAFAGDDRKAQDSRVAGIPADASYHTLFQAVQSSLDALGPTPVAKALGGDAIVVDRGVRWLPEMLDFNLEATRELVVRTLEPLLDLPAIDEIVVNTRSHTQLAASMADGELGVQSIAVYRAQKKGHYHLGIDRAYAPRALAADARLQTAAAQPETLGKITHWQPGAWQGTCQDPESPYLWRVARNQAVASGMRLLLRDLERAFPDTRIRVVIPERQRVTQEVQDALERLERDDGTVYGRDYYRHIWGSLNLIPSIGEGMAMVDLNGLRCEPVFLGIRHLPDQAALELFMQACLDDMAANHGSSFRGSRSIMYEAQYSLRGKNSEAAGERREAIIRYLLSLRPEIGEVILYEAADWLYRLPFGEAGVGPHGYLDSPDRGGQEQRQGD